VIDEILKWCLAATLTFIAFLVVVGGAWVTWELWEGVGTLLYLLGLSMFAFVAWSVRERLG